MSERTEIDTRFIADEFMYELPAGESAREFAEDDEEDVSLPDPDDDEAWAKWEKEFQRILKGSGKRATSELLSFARPYNYGKKLDEMAGALEDRLGQLAADLREGRIKQSQWSLDSRRAIIGHQGAAYELGIAQAKGIAPSKVKLTPDQRRQVIAGAEEQNKYWAKFGEKVKGQLADGRELTTALDARAKLYAGSVRSAVSKAKLDEQESKKMRWVRYPGDSCDTCLQHGGEVRTGKEWRELDVWPAHQVTCRGNCRCLLEEVKSGA